MSIIDDINEHHIKFSDIYNSVANRTIGKNRIKKFDQETDTLIAIVKTSNDLTPEDKESIISDFTDYKTRHIKPWLGSNEIPDEDPEVRFNSTPTYRK